MKPNSNIAKHPDERRARVLVVGILFKIGFRQDAACRLANIQVYEYHRWKKEMAASDKAAAPTKPDKVGSSKSTAPNSRVAEAQRGMGHNEIARRDRGMA